MNDRLCWEVFDKYNYILHYVRYRKHQVYEKLFGLDYWAMPRFVAGKKLMSTPKTNQIIYDAIVAGKPFWAGRFGGTEMNMIYQQLLYRMHPEKASVETAVNQLCMLSGFFPNDLSLAEKFVDLMLQDCGQMDLLAEWRRYMEDYIYVQYQPDTMLTQLLHLEPWNMYQHPRSKVKPWSAALKGKKVLVVHPFEKSIREQYENNRKYIFERIYNADDILPQFELKTLKAVQTLAGEEDDRFKTWFDALNWMTEQCRHLDFDVAIIGCGAYGFPLAAEVKRMGKIVIHLGGVTQILFGIIGSRWEEEYSEFHRDVVNEYWIRPQAEERITNANAVESACYW
jgi:hypothetical protein